MSTLAIPAFRKRSIALALAVVLAALATVALVSYIRGVENRATAGAETVSVYVAKADIPANMSASQALSAGLIERTSVPRNLLVPGAITSLLAIEGKVAGAQILQGEQIATARFVAPATAAGLALPIPKGKQGFALAVSVPHGVAGFINPGNHISLIGNYDLVGDAAKKAGLTGAKEARYIVQNIEVLAVDRSVTGPVTTTTTANGDKKTTETTGPNQDASTILVTLALSPADAERVAYSAFGGDNLWVTLLPEGQLPVKTSGRNPLNITR